MEWSDFFWKGRYDFKNPGMRYWSPPVTPQNIPVPSNKSAAITNSLDGASCLLLDGAIIINCKSSWVTLSGCSYIS